MIRLILFLKLLLIFGIVSIAHAGDDIFQFVEKCIVNPTLPPNDWTYEGTILFSGYAGIHGINAEWDTPHVMAFLRNETPRFYEHLVGKQISPDGKWYAVPMGESYTEFTHSVYTFISGLRVYPTDGSGAYIEFDLDDYIDIYNYWATGGTYLLVQWIDNESFMIGGWLIHPFTKEVEPAPTIIISGLRWLSPDSTRYLSGGLRDVESGETLSPIEANALLWKHDSSGFIAEIDYQELQYFNRDGELQNKLIKFDEGFLHFIFNDSGRNDLQWSPDNTQFAFVEPDSDHLYIIDFENEQIIDTCLKARTHPVWSEDGKMLAFLANAKENDKIVVVDLEQWQAFDIGRHIALYQLEMIGWHD